MSSAASMPTLTSPAGQIMDLSAMTGEEVARVFWGVQSADWAPSAPPAGEEEVVVLCSDPPSLDGGEAGALPPLEGRPRRGRGKATRGGKQDSPSCRNSPRVPKSQKAAKKTKNPHIDNILCDVESGCVFECGHVKLFAEALLKMCNVHARSSTCKRNRSRQK